MEHRKCQKMMEMMETLSVIELDMEMEWIESKILEMMECDVGDGQDAQDELEDEDGDQIMPEVDSMTRMEVVDTTDMVKEYDQRVVDDLDMDTLPERVENSHMSNGGSVVVVGSYDYPHHCGGGHTPLLGPATIPENGVELGLVIGLQPT